MRNFKQYITEAVTKNFGNDFEQVLNLIVGGHWTLQKEDEIAGFGGSSNMGVNAHYRGMSMNGRHYELNVNLINQNYIARTDGPKEYDPREGSENIIFSLGDVVELGKNAKNFAGEEKPTSALVHDHRNDSFFKRPIDMAKSIKENIAKYESESDAPKYPPVSMRI